MDPLNLIVGLRFMDSVHQNLDVVHGPPIFTTPKTSGNQRLIMSVTVLCLWYNLNSCLLKMYRQKVSHHQKLEYRWRGITNGFSNWHWFHLLLYFILFRRLEQIFASFRWDIRVPDFIILCLLIFSLPVQWHHLSMA